MGSNGVPTAPGGPGGPFSPGSPCKNPTVDFIDRYKYAMP